MNTRGWLLVLLTAGCARPTACHRISSELDQGKALQLADRPIDWSGWRKSWPDRPEIGQVRYLLPVDDARLVQLQLTARLGGAEVEAIGHRADGTSSARWHERSHDDALVFELPAGTDELEVIVHHHLRAAPELVGWRSGLGTCQLQKTVWSRLFHHRAGG